MGPVLAITLMGLTSACRYGQSVDEFPPAHEPGGAMIGVDMGETRVEGELVEVRDDAVVVLADGLLQAFPYASIRSIRIGPTGRSVDTRGRPPVAERREELRLLSRYPHGVSPEVLERLLAAYGQTAIAGGLR